MAIEQRDGAISDRRCDISRWHICVHQHIIRPAHPLLNDVFRNADRCAILENMKTDKSSAIIAEMTPEYAAKITKKMALLQDDAS